MRSWVSVVGVPWHRAMWGDLVTTMRTGEPAFQRVHGMPPWEYFRQNPDVDGLNAAIGTIKSLGSAAVGAFPVPIPILPFIVESIGTNTISVRGWYDQAMYTVEGPITGSYADTDDEPNGQLTIDWATDPQLEMPITFWLDGVNGPDEIYRGALATEPLWPVAATVSEQGGVLQAVATHNDNPPPADGVTTTTNTSWSARRA